MEKKEKETKKMLSHEEIYRIMQWLPPVVASVFFLKNLTGGNTTALLTIGICLVVFVGVLIFVKVRNVSLYVKEYVLAIALPILVFVISLNSGASYSDDFPMFLAVIGLTGLYLEPQFTKIQIILIDILFIAMYKLHPEKAGSTSQYFLCLVIFTLAAFLFYLVIKRGRAFIEISEERAAESEKLLCSVRAMGVELQRDFDASSARIEVSTQGVQQGSVSITHIADEVSESCGVVHEKVKETEEQIGELNKEVKQFEEALAENRNNVETMNRQVNSVSDIICESGTIFRTMEEQMNEIAGIAQQINDISFRLTILSLNAAVEAAHAGKSGSGFEVLASEMRELSESSTNFSNRVSDVVKELLERVETTSTRISGSETALEKSQKAMSELVGSFEKLNQQFGMLYGNIEQQNKNVNQIDYIFGELNQRVSEMHNSSMTNQNAVESIVRAMEVYRGNVEKIVKNTQTI